MKRFFALLLAALLLAVPALAQGYTLILPEGFSWVEDEPALAGYLAAAGADADSAFSGEARLALGEGASISVVRAETDAPDAQSASEAILAGYAEYIAGFESVQPEAVTIGENAFWRYSFAIDDALATQYCAVREGEMVLITLINADEGALAGFSWND